jgi:hypothetical protein
VIRSYNFTGRVSLDHQDVSIEVASGPGQEVTVDWSACKKKVPDDAKVVVEAKTAGAMQSLRFEWGTWKQPTPPPDRCLAPLGATTFSFDVKAVDSSSGRIVAAQWNVRPPGHGDGPPGSSESLLWLNFEDLGQLSWSLAFEDDGVALTVNDRLPDARRFAESPMFVAMVFPAVIRIVLIRALTAGADEDGDTWARHWVMWARELRDPGFDVTKTEGGGLTPEHDAWIDGVVHEFASRFQTIDNVVSNSEAK